MEHHWRKLTVPIDVRAIAVRLAVASFFVVGFVGWFSGLCPFVCCKRAAIGAIVAYIIGTFIIRAVNAILIDAIARQQADREMESNHAGKH